MAAGTEAADTQRVHVVHRELKPRELTSGGTGEPYDAIDCNPLSRLIGAEIRNIDLSKPLPAAQLAELRRAFLEWKVLFFRNQDLTAQQHADFARNWGSLEVSPFNRKAAIGEVDLLERDQNQHGVENIWHSDGTCFETPPLGAALRAVEVPELGGDTLWADMAAAYDGLSPDIKNRIDELTAVHALPYPGGGVAVLLKRIDAKAGRRPVEHPVVRTHPETGRRSIFVNPAFTSHIVGLPDDESRELLGILNRQAQYPEYQVRFHWENGSIALWDNRNTVHYGVYDYYPCYRRMERVAIAGSRPR
jgi:taurine dioxygenase